MSNGLLVDAETMDRELEALAGIVMRDALPEGEGKIIMGLKNGVIAIRPYVPREHVVMVYFEKNKKEGLPFIANVVPAQLFVHPNDRVTFFGSDLDFKVRFKDPSGLIRNRPSFLDVRGESGKSRAKKSINLGNVVNFLKENTIKCTIAPPNGKNPQFEAIDPPDIRPEPPSDQGTS